MKCEKCGENLPENARYCLYCGEPVSASRPLVNQAIFPSTPAGDAKQLREVKCPQCGRFNLAEITFQCQKCARSHLCESHRDKDTLLCRDCARTIRPLAQEDRQAELESAHLTKDWRLVAERCQMLLLDSDLAESARNTMRAMVSEAYYWITKDRDFGPADLHEFLANLYPLIEKSPDNADLWWLRGLVRFHLRARCHLGFWEDVLSDFEQAIKINPRQGYYHFWHGRTYFWADDQKQPIGSLENALHDYDHAIELDPSPAYFYRSRGIRISFFRRNREAIDDFNHAINLDPNVADFYLWRGNSFDSCFDYQNAINDYTRAIELDPRVPDFYIQLGFSYNEAGDYQTAIANFTHAIDLNPTVINYYRIRGVSYHYAEEYQKAIDDFTLAIDLDPTNAYTFFLRGISHINSGDSGNAVTDYSRAIRLDPNVAGYYRQRGVGYALLGEHQKALQDFNRAIELDPGDPDYYHQRGLSYQAIGESSLAEDDLTRAANI